MRKADGMPSLNSDGDDQEDAGREGEVAAALKEGENRVDEDVVKSKVKRQNKKVGEKKDDIGNTETREEVVEKI